MDLFFDTYLPNGFYLIAAICAALSGLSCTKSQRQRFPLIKRLDGKKLYLVVGVIVCTFFGCVLQNQSATSTQRRQHRLDEAVTEGINKSEPQPQTTQELEAHLHEQIGFLVRSAEYYDKGQRDEAKRMASSLRLLLYDSLRNRSLLSQLRIKDELLFANTIIREDKPSIKSAYTGLVGINIRSSGASEYIPRLGFASQLPAPDGSVPKLFLPFETWWNTVVINDKKGASLTRGELILAISEHDGGIRVSGLDPKYYAVSRQNISQMIPMNMSTRITSRQIIDSYSSSFNVVLEEKQVVSSAYETEKDARIQFVELASVRAITWEVLTSIQKSFPHFMADYQECIGRAVSKDGQHVADVYANRAKGECYVVVDGQSGPMYDDIPVQSLRFSDNGERLAYIGIKGTNQITVLDGKSGPAFDAIIMDSFLFSPNGGRFAYGATKGTNLFVVLDGDLGPAIEGIGFTQAPGPKIGLFMLSDTNINSIGVDLRVPVSSFVFSADSSHFAYVAVKETKQFVIFDGRSGLEYDNILGPVVLAGSTSRYAYVAQRTGQSFLVIDGFHHQVPVDGVMPESIAFSADGEKLALAVVMGDKKAVAFVHSSEGKTPAVVFIQDMDHSVVPLFDDILPGSLKFVNDGSLEFSAVTSKTSSPSTVVKMVWKFTQTGHFGGHSGGGHFGVGPR